MLLLDCPITTAVWQFCENNLTENTDSPRNPCVVATHINKSMGTWARKISSSAKGLLQICCSFVTWQEGEANQRWLIQYHNAQLQVIHSNALVWVFISSSLSEQEIQGMKYG